MFFNIHCLFISIWVTGVRFQASAPWLNIYHSKLCKSNHSKLLTRFVLVSRGKSSWLIYAIPSKWSDNGVCLKLPRSFSAKLEMLICPSVLTKTRRCTYFKNNIAITMLITANTVKAGRFLKGIPITEQYNKFSKLSITFLLINYMSCQLVSLFSNKRRRN